MLRAGRTHIRSMSFTRDGTRLASATLIRGQAGSSGELTLQHVALGEPKGVKDAFGAAVVAADGSLIVGLIDASGPPFERQGGEELGAWRIPSGKLAWRVRLPRWFDVGASVLAASPDGRWLAAGTWDGPHVLLIDLRTRRVLRALPGRCAALAFSRDGRTLAVSHSNRGSVALWRVPDGVRTKTLSARQGDVSGLAFAPDGRTLACAGQDGAIFLWGLGRGKSGVVRVFGHTHAVESVVFSPDGRFLVSDSGDGTVRVWAPRTGAPLLTLQTLGALPPNAFEESAEPQEWIAYTPDGYYTASAGAEPFIRWRDALGLQPARAYSERFRRPDRVRGALR